MSCHANQATQTFPGVPEPSRTGTVGARQERGRRTGSRQGTPSRTVTCHPWLPSEILPVALDVDLHQGACPCHPTLPGHRLLPPRQSSEPHRDESGTRTLRVGGSGQHLTDGDTLRDRRRVWPVFCQVLAGGWASLLLPAGPLGGRRDGHRTDRQPGVRVSANPREGPRAEHAARVPLPCRAMAESMSPRKPHRALK